MLLSDRIIRGEIAPGERLPSEAELAIEFRASRPVIREALQRLQTLGYVRTRTGAGSYALTPPSLSEGDDWLSARGPAERAELHTFRTAIEQEAAALAARTRTESQLAEIDDAIDQFLPAVLPADTVEADFAFHQAVAAASGNRFIVEAVDRIGARAIVVPASRIASAERRGDGISIVAAEHAAVADAIRGRDPVAAAAAMRAHLFASVTRLGTGRP
ncbi:FadR/GntR family transcriptional regulator [Microbacterium kribbense]|uniref:FadR/GntR family transcriptional regulator n=1 Tax=Microbacterium kribbense TaxID=433645 RepID=UPI0031D69C29